MSQIQLGGIQAWRRCMSLAQRCANMRQLKAVHAIFISHGLHLHNYAVSKLIAFCALSDSGNLRYASLIFDQVETPNSYIYNTLIRAYSRSSQPRLALHYFQLMLNTTSDIVPDHHTFHFVLLACVNGGWTALIRLYSECNVIDDARKMFDEIPCRDPIQWNATMNGYIRCGLACEALRLFHHMLVCGIKLDEYCIATGLSACTHLGLFGRASGYMRMPNRNVFSWAAMIGGFAVHGHATKAIRCLERMHVEDRLRPDEIVLLGVLMACSHAGLQKDARFLLDNMETHYGFSPKHEHYSCVVDLLCRAGQLREALVLIRRMPMKPQASVWGALLNGCRISNNIELAEFAVKELLLLENADMTEEDGAYVQLSNIYLAARRSEDALRIRKMIGGRGMKKTPGCSMIEVDGKVNEFVSGDVAHSHRVEIWAMLDLLSAQERTTVIPVSEY
ncbi:hypothetical protein FNV43_RR14437 [Rhamnella rubrinervis]|uniref:Pentatricopeptide repeat-containing protein n=1 Tax=Rhamnella rubrinervis TaxID=2594499 RepID=A0A8K0H335_9ROSA|nr:hypothetical protein FNV43_RR14437 [Rhamnella rubrinervis]